MQEKNDGDNQNKPRILYIDMAYTLKMVYDRELQQEFESRDCDGYFGHVWGVHPFATLADNITPNYKGFEISETKFSDNQTIIEGSPAYYNSLKHFYFLNVLLSQIKFTAYLIKLVKRKRIDLVLTSDPYFSGLIGLAIKIFTPAKLVIWVIANYDLIYKATGAIAMPRMFKWRWVEKLVERITFRGADLIAGGNQDNLEYALENGGNAKKGTVFPVGKLIHRQHLKESSLRENDEIFKKTNARYHFIYVGRLNVIKYPDDVLQAFSLIEKEIPDAAVLLAGEGPMRNELEKMVKDLGIADKVFFLGNISQLRLANILAGCFAVLSPATGRSLIECALAGLPIVAYELDWQPEFLARDGAGVIVPFRDWQKMGEAAIRFVKNPDEAKRMGSAARKTGLDAADLKKLYQHEQEQFDKLLKR